MIFPLPLQCPPLTTRSFFRPLQHRLPRVMPDLEDTPPLVPRLAIHLAVQGSLGSDTDYARPGGHLDFEGARRGRGRPPDARQKKDLDEAVVGPVVGRRREVKSPAVALDVHEHLARERRRGANSSPQAFHSSDQEEESQGVVPIARGE